MSNYPASVPKTGFTGLTGSTIATNTGRSFTAGDLSALDVIVAQIEGVLCRKCNRQFKVLGAGDYYEEVFRADQTDVYLRNFPVSSIHDILLDGTTITPVQGNQYKLLYPNHLTLSTGYTAEYQIVKVQYNIDLFWGDDVKLAVQQMALQALANAKANGNILTETFAGQTTTFKESEMLPIQTVIETYRSINV